MEVVLHLPRDTNKICRTCMDIVEAPEESFEHCIVKNNQLTELGEILENVTQRKITVDGYLPETICSECLSNLKTAHTYKLRAKKVEEQLENVLVECKTEKQDDFDLETSSVDEGVSDIIHLIGENTCSDCCKDFPTYYQLCLHNIEHHKNSETITQQFLKTREVPQVINSNIDTEIDVNILKLINERKEYGEKYNKSNKLKCKFCLAQFGLRKEFITHICKPLKRDCNSSVENSKLTVCPLCDKSFFDTSSLSLHFLKHTFVLVNLQSVLNIKEEFIFCEICGELFEELLHLQQHYDEKHDGKPTWICSVCFEKFENESDLLKHNEIHVSADESSIQKDFTCVLCPDTFTTKYALLKHAIGHLMKKYTCRKCPLSFCTQLSYEAHSKSHFYSTFSCPTCDKILSSRSSLKAHIVGVHSVELLHKCEVCGKGFATLNRLKVHLQIHSTKKQYQCSYCGYATHKPGDLKTHIRIHTCERPYKCTFSNCNHSFKTSSHLCDHVRRHLNIRKFKCPICLLTFTTNHGLKIHSLQHTGEKPHTCQICQGKFRRKYHLTVHMKQHGIVSSK